MPLLAIIIIAAEAASSSSFLNLRYVMENKEAEGVQQEEVAAAAVPETCFRRTVGQDVTFMESARDRLRQFKDAPAVEHWACLKNKVRAMFGEPKIGSSAVEGGIKDDGATQMVPSVES